VTVGEMTDSTADLGGRDYAALRVISDFAKA
jgi:hypothetical protein